MVGIQLPVRRPYVATLTMQRPIVYKWEVALKPFYALDASTCF